MTKALECASCGFIAKTIDDADAHVAREQVTDPDHGGWDVFDSSEILRPEKDSADPFERDSRGVAIGLMDDDPMGYEF